MSVISMRRPGRALPVLAAFLLVLLAALSAVLASSGSSSNAQTTSSAAVARTWTVKVGAQTSSMAVQGMAYGPKAIWINVGDTVHWVAQTPEPHTVSFINAAHPLAPFNPGTHYMVTRTKATSISQPGQFRNSGILATLPSPEFAHTYTSYNLKFTGIGDYHYLCYVHGAPMTGVVHVRKVGTPYKFTQAQYNQQAANARLRMIEHGLNLWGAALGSANNQHVYAGASDTTAMVMRFIPGNVTVHVGDSVTFDMARNTGIAIPHTVTFGIPPANIGPPSGDPTNYTGGDLHSGVLLPPGFGPPGSSTFTVTFNAAGTFTYLCMFHDSMGMHGKVTVLP